MLDLIQFIFNAIRDIKPDTFSNIENFDIHLIAMINYSFFDIVYY